MMRFLLFSAVSAFLMGSMALAQTPQQMEMLKNKGLLEKKEDKPVGVYKDEKTGKFVFPKNEEPARMILPTGEEVILPMAKTDEELKQTYRGPNTKFMNQMSQDEIQQYLDYVVQDRIFLSVENRKVLGDGLTKVCPITLQIINNTPRIIKRLNVEYRWGDTHMPVEFANVIPLERVEQKVALAGPVCDLVLKGFQTEMIACVIDGLTEEQCEMRIAER